MTEIREGVIKNIERVVHAPERVADWLHHKLGMDRLMGETREQRSKAVDSIVEQAQQTGSVGGLEKMGIESSLPEEERAEAHERLEAAKWSHQTRKDLKEKGDSETSSE